MAKMTPTKLRSYTAKDLAQMARRNGVTKWHSMRKDELIAVLAKKAVASGPTSRSRQEAANASNSADTVVASSGKTVQAPAPRRRPTAAQKRIATMQRQRLRMQDLSTSTPEATADQLLLLVRDPYWLHVTWELSPASVARAKTALGQHWHGAVPVLRVGRIGDDGAVAATRQVKVHGDVSHWYVDLSDPPSRYRAEIGYVDVAGEFYSLARSNEVITPEPGVGEAGDDAWSDVARNADRVYALSGGYTHGGASQELRQALEQRLQRPLGRPSETRSVTGAGVASESSLHVDIDAELVVRGTTTAHTHLTIQGEPVAVREDGHFAVKLPFPDRRQVIPVVASSADGLHQKTIILGVERNTKALEPRRRDSAAS